MYHATVELIQEGQAVSCASRKRHYFFAERRTIHERINQVKCTADASTIPAAERGAYYTPQELADLWKCSISTVYTMLRQGKLSGFKLGRDWRITESAVRAYEQAPENQSAMTYHKPENDRRRNPKPTMPLRVV